MKRANEKIIGTLVLIMVFMTFLLSSGFNNKVIYSEKGTLYFDKSKKNIEGLYILNSCEKGRFKITINNKGSIYIYSILDGKKTISKGKISIRNEDRETIIAFGNIAGLYTKNNIIIQNYGNSMNEYIHFTQCDEKYLIFIKKKE